MNMSRAIRSSLKDTIAGYPEEALTMRNHVAHTVDRARNRFSKTRTSRKKLDDGSRSLFAIL